MSAGSGLNGVSSVPFGHDALGDHARQDPLAVGVVAVVELALVLVDVFLRAWCGAWLAPGQNHMNQGFEGLLAFWSRDHRDGLVGQVLGEVIALLRGVRLFDVVVVLDQVGIPLVGLAAEEAVEAVEALLQRPLLAGSRRRRGPVREHCGSCPARRCSSRCPAGSARSWRTRPGCGRARRETRWLPR